MVANRWDLGEIAFDAVTELVLGCGGGPVVCHLETIVLPR
jgi:hypothetical protein